jgi:hypothetical protein
VLAGQALKLIGIAQCLIITCQLHDIRSYDYLVDVLQRVGQHPAARVEELTPRLWKMHFAHQRLRSPVDSLLRKQERRSASGYVLLTLVFE